MIIKYSAEEFNVLEDSQVGHKKDDCLVATVEKVNWDTTILVKELAKKLGISHKGVGYAGLKDKRSRSIQKMSFYGVERDRLEELRLNDVSIIDIGRGDRINIGDLNGNGFKIVVRGLKGDINAISRELSLRIDELNGWHGFINYFGYQRFGLQRPVTADVGKLLVKKDYEGAALAYIGKVYPDDPMGAARQEFLDDMDFKRAYENFPVGLRYERAMLFSLAHEGSDFKGCFKALPERLLNLFVHGYQSKLFNEIVRRRTEKIPPNVAEMGDNIVSERFGRKATALVNKANITRVEKMVEKSVSVSAPLIGSRTILPKSTMGSISKDVMAEEGVTFDDFKNKEVRAFESSGTQREILARFSDLDHRLGQDDIFNGIKCDISFYLKKGQYATELLRQLFGEEALPYRDRII